MNAVDRVIEWLERLNIRQRIIVVGALPAAVIAIIIWAAVTDTDPTPADINSLIRDTLENNDTRPDSQPDTRETSEPELPVAAITECRDAVRDQLTVPSSADFDMYPGRENVGPGRWHVAGMVTASNSFGLESEYEYACVITATAGGRVTVEDAAIREPQS